jgi:hypothetical protein
MLRLTIAFVLGTIASGSAMSADRAVLYKTSYHVRHRAAVILPAGLPRPHYRFRTTISWNEGEPAYRYWDRPPYACGGFHGYC